MRNRLSALQICVMLAFFACFLITERGVNGTLESRFLRERVFPWCRRVSAATTDWKFRARGVEAPKNKVVLVAIDEDSLAEHGRWPWHRDLTARLIDATFKAGARVVGLDMVFSESDARVAPELRKILAGNGLAGVAETFETDPVLEKVIAKHSQHLVLGWTAEASCQPLYTSAEECPVTNPDAIALFPPGIEKFSVTRMDSEKIAFDPGRTPLDSFVTFIANLAPFNQVATHAGYFKALTDPDGTVRREPLFMLAGGHLYPALPLQMAAVGQGEKLVVKMNPTHGIESARFLPSGRSVQLTAQGVLDINFRGPGHSFNYVSAKDVLSNSDTLEDYANRKLAGVSKTEVLKDAYVLIGATALGINDLRNFPFEEGVAGTEGLANILDNLLSGDELRSKGHGPLTDGWLWVSFLMVFAALGFGLLMQKLEAIPALLLSLTTFVLFGLIDVKVLFARQINWNTGFLYWELTAIFVLTLAAKYVDEERNKKFIRGAFSKYVAPAVVDAIMKDPTSLMLGGEKKELTILFSDIRGFTTMSEAMDAKALAGFLNDYLSIMTEIVFKHGGTLDKYIGDAVMAFWGAPLPEHAHALRSCLAAVDMMQALETHRPRFKSQYGFDVDIGIGVNTGLVNVGNMGSVNNFEYTVIGDHVNLASRLEGLTKYYGASIITSRFTLDQIAASAPMDAAKLPPYRTLDFVKVKGKKNAVELLQLLHRDYPPEALMLFADARLAYARRDWDEAIEKLRSASRLIAAALGKEDGPSELLIERCLEFKKTPPDADWDGSWEMHSK